MTAEGVQVHALGSRQSQGLKHSRFLKSFQLAEHPFDGSFSDEMIDEVNTVVRRTGAEIVFPGDAPSSRSFAAIRKNMDADCFPGPDLETFDLLNNKKAFQSVCEELGIRCPPSQVYQNKLCIELDIKTKDIKLPVIAKPLNLDGEKGIAKMTSSNYLQILEEIDYEPILIQEFIDGSDIGASIYCRDGHIESFIAHRLAGGIYSTFKGVEIFDAVLKIARRFSLNGVYNFDMRLATDGAIYFLECNPRFFFKICLSLVAGINFVEPGLRDLTSEETIELPNETHTKTPRAWPKAVVRPWTVTPHDLKNIGFLLSDPVSYLREQARIDWD